MRFVGRREGRSPPGARPLVPPHPPQVDGNRELLAPVLPEAGSGHTCSRKREPVPGRAVPPGGQDCPPSVPSDDFQRRTTPRGLKKPFRLTSLSIKGYFKTIYYILYVYDTHIQGAAEVTPV